MNASKKVLVLAGVVIGLAGTFCVGTALVSAAFALSHLSEFADRMRSMATWAGIGMGLVVLGGVLIGRAQLRRFRSILRDDLGSSVCVAAASPWEWTGSRATQRSRAASSQEVAAVQPAESLS